MVIPEIKDIIAITEQNNDIPEYSPSNFIADNMIPLITEIAVKR